jgi:hypothetical protein
MNTRLSLNKTELTVLWLVFVVLFLLIVGSCLGGGSKSSASAPAHHRVVQDNSVYVETLRAEKRAYTQEYDFWRGSSEADLHTLYPETKPYMLFFAAGKAVEQDGYRGTDYEPARLGILDALTGKRPRPRLYGS